MLEGGPKVLGSQGSKVPRFTGGVWSDFKTVPGFAFRAIFDGCIEGFTLLKVLLATTVLT